MTDPIAPVVRVILQPSGTEVWEVRCPWCSAFHTHGGEPGWRAPHCGSGAHYRLHLDQATVQVVVAALTGRTR